VGRINTLEIFLDSSLKAEIDCSAGKRKTEKTTPFEKSREKYRYAAQYKFCGTKQGTLVLGSQTKHLLLCACNSFK